MLPGPASWEACATGLERYGEDFGLQSLAAAGVAELRVHERLETVAGEFALGFLVKTFEIGNDALEGAGDCADLARAREMELDFCLARAAQKSFLEVLRQRTEWRFQGLVIMSC